MKFKLLGLSALFALTTPAISEQESMKIEGAPDPVEVAADVMRARLAKWAPPAMKYESGVFAKYVALVGSAAEGAVTSRPTFATAKA